MEPAPNIALTAAQRNHIASLLAARNQAERELQQFMTYLYSEYGITPDDYPTVDATKGFIPKQAA